MIDLDSVFMELRSEQRIEVNSIVLVIDEYTGAQLGKLVNFSDQGMMLSSEQVIPENSVYQLQLVFTSGDNTEIIHLGAESLWSHRGNDSRQIWTGFYIIDITPEALSRIRQLLT